MSEKFNCARDIFLENTHYSICAIKDKSICCPYLAQIKQILQDEIRVFCDKAAAKRHKPKTRLRKGNRN